MAYGKATGDLLVADLLKAYLEIQDRDDWTPQEQCPLSIKGGRQTLYSKAATHWTRLSCHRFRANEVR